VQRYLDTVVLLYLGLPVASIDRDDGDESDASAHWTKSRNCRRLARPDLCPSMPNPKGHRGVIHDGLFAAPIAPKPFDLAEKMFGDFLS
jgi:hypothetical protein